MCRISSLLTVIAGFTCSCLAKSNVQQIGFINIPPVIHGEWYSFEGGDNVSTVINEEKWNNDKDGTELRLTEIFLHPNSEYPRQGRNVTMLMAQHDSSSLSYTNCLKCVDVLWRTENILQYREGECLSAHSGSNISLKTSCTAMTPGYGLPSTDETFTMFRKTPVNINCETTFKGIYQFSYEQNMDGGGICNNSDSRIEACQNPGSQYLDNEVFLMSFGKCDDIYHSYNKKVRYQCMGSWDAVRSGIQYTYAAVADTVEKVDSKKYKCLMTIKNQIKTENKVRWVMSRFSDCNGLYSIYSGPVRLVLKKGLPRTSFLTPQCSLPKDISGSWLTQEKNSSVKINETHIHFQTAFEFSDAYYSCQKTQETYYLMTRAVVGECEVSFVCIDIDRRQDGTVRYMMGFPHQLSFHDKENPDLLNTMFRKACSPIRSKFLYKVQI